MKNTKKRFVSIQYLRAIAALMVVLHHVENTLSKSKFYGQPLFPFLWEGQSGVQLFFVISGFVIWFSHKQDIGNPQCARYYIYSRAARIIPPLWGVLLLLVPIYYFIFPDYFKMQYFPQALLLLPQEQENWLAVEWTLRHEVLFYLLFLAMICQARLGVVLMTTWLLGSALIPLIGFDYPTTFFFSPNHILFAMGVFAAELCMNKNVARPILFALTGAMLYGMVWYFNLNYLDGKYAFNIYGYGLASLLIIIGLVNIEKSGSFLNIKFIKYLGGASYSIYLIHYPVISAGAHFGRKMPWLRDQQPMVFVLLAIAGTVGGLLYFEIVERPVSHVCKNWLKMARV